MIKTGFKFGIGFFIATQLLAGVSKGLGEAFQERGIWPYNEKES